ncbi:MAG: hypothetical protein IKQ24_06100 [Verrucomicrobia bacterium]|nr:hypothetical protein [Verrucomicrobiota bacterium]
MARRPVFLADDQQYVKTVIIPYDYCGGLTAEQRKSSIDNLHKACRDQFPEARVLEITKDAPETIGRALSASRLKLIVNTAPRFKKRKRFPKRKRRLIRKTYLKKSFEKKLLDKNEEEQEALFRKASQRTCSLKKTNSAFFDVLYLSARVCERGGPFPEVLRKRPYEARKSSRLTECGRVIGFRWEKKNISAEPGTLFYTWLYLWALKRLPTLGNQLMEYDILPTSGFSR